MPELQNYWPIGVSIVGLIAWFARLEFNSADNRTRIRTLEEKEHDLQPVLTQVAKDIAEIKADLRWLKDGNRSNNKQSINVN